MQSSHSTKDDVMVSRDRCFCDVSKLTTRRRLESNPNFSQDEHGSLPLRHIQVNFYLFISFLALGLT